MRRLAALALALALGCGARERAETGPDQDKKADASASASPSGDSSAMGMAGLFGALGRIGEPGYWDEAKQGELVDGKYHAVLELAGGLVELEAFTWFDPGGGTPIASIGKRLRALAEDGDVQSILLRVGNLSASMAQAEELRTMFAAVRAKKPIHCFTESAVNTEYFVLTACDSITLTPLGEVAVTGPVAVPLYLKGLLDKLAIEADFLHIGAFKGAAEPLTREGPSPEMRATFDAILDGAYARLIEGIAAGRKLDPARVKALVDIGMFRDELARKEGLIDAVATWEAFRDEKSGGAWKKVPLDKPKSEDMQALLQMLGSVPRKRISEPHVALIYAVGNVVDGKGEGFLQRGAEIAPRYLVPALRAAASDDSVKAVVLRVDSGGGSALASETIWHAARALAEKKPLVVSMGSVAASGGYYIAAPATAIWAQPDTITGSIGVVGGKIVLGPALARVGVTSVELSRGKRAGLMTSLRRWTADERGAVADSMQGVYDRFKSRVADGRKKKPEEIEPLAQGRVWIGSDAKARGLVDELGGLDDALADARKRANLPDDAPVDIYPPEPTLVEILGALTGQVSAGRLLLAELKTLLGARAAHSVAAALDALASFQREPVQVVLFWPLGG